MPESVRLFPRAISVAFAATIAVLLAALIGGLMNLRDVYTASEAVAHTNAAKDSLDALQLTLVDAETGQRGFIITNDEAYLEPYARAAARIDAEIATIRQRTADNPQQQADLDGLSRLARVKMSEIDEAMRLHRERGFAAAQAVTVTNVGKRTMDQIRATVARMEAREDALLAVRTASAARSYRTALLTEGLTSGLAVLAVCAVLLATRRLARERQSALETAARLRESEQQRSALLESERLARLEAERAANDREEFLAIASHELRNPVNALQLSVFSIRKHLEREGSSRAANGLADRVERVAAHVTRLAHMLENLLDASRIGAGALRFESEPLDLRELVEETLEQFREELTLAPAHVVAPPAPVIGRWDRLRLGQVVANLVSNALKYGEGRPIEIGLSANGPSARLDVRDYGIGISGEQQQHLFGRYARAVSGRQYGGFGLGLWITRQIVQAMGGEISVVSSPGSGSTFSVVLPIGSADEPAGQYLTGAHPAGDQESRV
jgi:signal transduction histidine kinase